MTQQDRAAGNVTARRDACGPQVSRWAWPFVAWFAMAISALPVLADADLAGKRIYDRAGCVACHGSQGQGTGFAPALAGHTVGQVERYVRNPQGKMPRFGADKISDSELHAVAVYVANLPMPHHPGGAVHGPDAQLAIETHLWIAHHALIAGDARHARMHFAHLLGLIQDTAQRSHVEHVIALVQAERLDEAARESLQMVTAHSDARISVDQLHLRLALGAIEAGHLDEARHYLEQYAQSASAHDRAHAEQVLASLSKGDLASAKTRLVHLMGG